MGLQSFWQLLRQHPILTGVITGLLVFLLTRLALGNVFDLSATCRDGWNSSSIGSQGACSHHGGVDRSKAQWASLVSILIGAIAGFHVNSAIVGSFGIVPSSSQSEMSKDTMTSELIVGHKGDSGVSSKKVTEARKLHKDHASTEGASVPNQLELFSGRQSWSPADRRKTRKPKSKFGRN